MLRIFVALPVPLEVSSLLAAVLPGDLAGLRRVGADLLHVTLAFVGWMGEERLADVTAAVGPAAREVRAFRVGLEGVGRFPPSGRPSVIWAGVGDEARAEIERLGQLVRSGLERRRVPFDPKPLRSHITLARVSDRATEEEARSIAAAAAAARLPAGLAFRAEAVHVMQSVLTRAGPRYSSRARIPLPEGGPAR